MKNLALSLFGIGTSAVGWAMTNYPSILPIQGSIVGYLFLWGGGICLAVSLLMYFLSAKTPLEHFQRFIKKKLFNANKINSLDSLTRWRRNAELGIQTCLGEVASQKFIASGQESLGASVMFSKSTGNPLNKPLSLYVEHLNALLNDTTSEKILPTFNPSDLKKYED